MRARPWVDAGSRSRGFWQRISAILESPELPRLQSDVVGAFAHAAAAVSFLVLVLVGFAARLLDRKVDGSEKGHVVYYRRKENVLIDLLREYFAT